MLLPESGAIANVVHHDLTYILKVTKFEMITSLKWSELTKNAQL